ncbi:AAA family ATPase [SAR92 clade bacterium H455]|uniref:AAA family ATPase n=1 Tax=SAR92 clade bacterium H455 TaxID=2974818 RepID=A0ABY5TRJ3_9GAMM|nr:AAA family ATPase [SAR92 clade bacterium H455]
MSIYLQHFALAREPFSIVPDPGFLYPSIYHRQAVAHLKYGLDREGGFILLTGEVGTGKTTLTRTMIKRIPPHVRVAYILNSKLNVADVLASICDELDIDLPNASELSLTKQSFTKQCIDALNRNLLAAHADGKKTLIVLEEAQNLTAEVLEALRLLSNLETSTDKLLHILLVGQPELLDILAQQELRQLNQRVVSRFHLSPLDKDDLSNYINHRLHRAGAKRAIFDSGCAAVLFRLTGGVPRLINLVCHQSLVAAYSTGAQTVSAKLVKQAASEILSEDKKSPRKIVWLLGIVVALGLSGGLILMLSPAKLLNQFSPVMAQLDAPEKISVVANDQPLGLVGEMPSEELDGVIEPLLPEPIVELPVTQEVSLQPEQLAPQTNANPFVGLLALWGTEAADVYSEEELTAVASLAMLRSEKVTTADMDTLEQINRPGIVWLLEETGYLKSYVLERLDLSMVKLQDRQGTVDIPVEDFQQRWNGSYLYLWRPPQSYVSPLSATSYAIENISNPELVDWLQAQLAALDNSRDIIISGGRYTAAIAQQVLGFQKQQGLAADGILGRETLMRLAQLSGDNIPLLREAGSRETESKEAN